MGFWCLKCKEGRTGGYCPQCGCLTRRVDGPASLALLEEKLEAARRRYPDMAESDPGLAVLMNEPYFKRD